MKNAKTFIQIFPNGKTECTHIFFSTFQLTTKKLSEHKDSNMRAKTQTINTTIVQHSDSSSSERHFNDTVRPENTFRKNSKAEKHKKGGRPKPKRNLATPQPTITDRLMGSRGCYDCR